MKKRTGKRLAVTEGTRDRHAAAEKWAYYLVLLKLVLDADPGAEVDDLVLLVLVCLLAAMRRRVAVRHRAVAAELRLLLPGGNVLAGAGHGLNR
jgi:hypothetical protein